MDAAPTRVIIPAIDVDAPVEPLGLDDQGRLEVPRGYDDVGWWSHGYPPGASGPAVLARHVDSRQRPAVFYRLRELRPGDNVTVEGNGRSVSFTVDNVQQYAKNSFPTARVYAGTRLPALRLITCGGQFDRSRGHYQDNVVVYATAS